MEDIDDLQDELAALQREHRELDEEINRLVATPPVDLLQIQRLKKKKLGLKDQIQKIRSNILPDIIAWPENRLQRGSTWRIVTQDP